MKRTICILLCLVFLACVPTPDEEYVVNKSEGTLEQAIHSEPIALPDATDGMGEDAPAVSPLYDRLGAPTHWTMEAETRAVPFANLTVLADAEVVLPNVSTVPVYASDGQTFSAAQLEAIASALFGDAERYMHENDWPKWEWKKRMQQQLDRIDEMKAHPEQYEGWFDEALAEEMQSLSYLSEHYESAPEDYACKPWNGSFTDGFMVRIAEQNYAFFRTFSGRIIVSRLVTESVIGGPFSMAKDAEPSPEADAARAVVDDFLQRAGLADELTVVRTIPDYARGSKGKGPVSGYEFILLPSYGGIVSGPYWTAHGSDTATQKAERQGLYEMPDYDRSIGPETVILLVEGGEVVYIDWSNHFERGTCENENVSLLPFADIERAFLNAVFTAFFLDEGDDTTVKITRIELNMMRLKRKDVKNGYYFVPVWDFLGYNTSMEDAPPEHYLNSRVTINAIDGTRIDRNAGY